MKRTDSAYASTNQNMLLFVNETKFITLKINLIMMGYFINFDIISTFSKDW